MSGVTSAPIERAPRVANGANRSMPRWGWVVSGFVGLFLLFDGGGRLIGFAPYVEGTVEFGFPAAYAAPIGLTLIVATLLFLIPRTSVYGAILLTGYLGGAAAVHVQRGDPWFLFAVLFGVLAWVGLYLRTPRLRELLPFQRST